MKAKQAKKRVKPKKIDLLYEEEISWRDKELSKRANEITELQELIAVLQADHEVAKRVVAMSQYMLRVAGQLDQDAKKLFLQANQSDD